MVNELHQSAGEAAHHQANHEQGQEGADQDRGSQIMLEPVNRFIRLSQRIVRPEDPVGGLQVLERGQGM